MVESLDAWELGSAWINETTALQLLLDKEALRQTKAGEEQV